MAVLAAVVEWFSGVRGGFWGGSRVFIGGADELLQNFFTHIRKLPHFDTRFGVAQTLYKPL